MISTVIVILATLVIALIAWWVTAAVNSSTRIY
jgi:hypothetical protein